PPIVFDADSIRTPVPLGRGAVPAASVPMKLPCTTAPPAPDSRMPLPPKRLTTSPRTVELPAATVRPLAPDPAARPSNAIKGVPANPGCDQPSRVTGSMIGGSADTGAIVRTPLPGMLKLIVSTPG